MACAAVFGLPPFLLRGVDCFLLRMSCLFSKYLRRRVCARNKDITASFSQSACSFVYIIAFDAPSRPRSRRSARITLFSPNPEPRAVVVIVVASSRAISRTSWM